MMSDAQPAGRQLRRDEQRAEGGHGFQRRRREHFSQTLTELLTDGRGFDRQLELLGGGHARDGLIGCGLLSRRGHDHAVEVALDERQDRLVANAALQRYQRTGSEEERQVGRLRFSDLGGRLPSGRARAFGRGSHPGSLHETLCVYSTAAHQPPFGRGVLVEWPGVLNLTRATARGPVAQSARAQS